MKKLFLILILFLNVFSGFSQYTFKTRTRAEYVFDQQSKQYIQIDYKRNKRCKFEFSHDFSQLLNTDAKNLLIILASNKYDEDNIFFTCIDKTNYIYTVIFNKKTEEIKVLFEKNNVTYLYLYKIRDFTKNGK